MNKNMDKIYGITLGITSLLLTSNVHSKSCSSWDIAAGDPRCVTGVNMNGNNQTASVINALTPALQQWAANMDAQRLKDEEESDVC